MAAGNPIVNTIARVAAAKGVDPVLAVATALHESSLNPQAVGDQGTSFGLYQLHRGGELGSLLPQQAYNPATNAAVALGTLAQYARGGWYASPGALAAAAQRPANPAAYAQAVDALLPQARALLAGVAAPGGPPTANAGPAVTRQGQREPHPAGINPQLLGLINQTNQSLGLTPLPATLLANSGNASAKPQPQPAAPPVKQPRLGGTTLRFLQHFAAPYGLTITSTTGGRHAKGSYHYRGRAVDLAGNPASMAALAKSALNHPQDFQEMFYSGPGNPGYYIKNGQAIPLAKLDPGLVAEHTNHVHLAA